MKTREAHTPLVIEPRRSTSVGFLKELLASHSSEIIGDIAAHGAILLRGFDIGSPSSFEDVVLSIQGLRGIRDVFMSEPGRTIVDGARFVLHTNALYKTGGALQFNCFHGENYHVPDVPRFVSFFCEVPARLGGETGLINSAGVYEDLSEGVKARLQQRAFLANAWPVAAVAARYRISAERVEAFCAEVELPTGLVRGERSVLLYKPSVLEHPRTGERALVTSFSYEFNHLGLPRALRRAFAPDYAAPRWTAHRLAWRYPWLELLGQTGTLLRAPRYAIGALYRSLTERGNREPDAADITARIEGAFAEEGVERLVRAMRDRFSCFSWRRGDVLIVDNLKMAHDGMPGFGPRRIRALICNPVSLPWSPGSPGLYAPREDGSRESVGARLLRFGGAPLARATGLDVAARLRARLRDRAIPPDPIQQAGHLIVHRLQLRPVAPA
ncbi:TauD/TfdA family dioxygenase [Sorangium sp. So ce124]|uniref:TauD/TfdA family dioxygenase n=1 Tax=Sorangium sp. So ce124 TaxID=3133280 RepID=UPI003F60CE40